jgi:hypothetical protein
MPSSPSASLSPAAAPAGAAAAAAAPSSTSCAGRQVMRQRAWVAGKARRTRGTHVYTTQVGQVGLRWLGRVLLHRIGVVDSVAPAAQHRRHLQDARVGRSRLAGHGRRGGGGRHCGRCVSRGRRTLRARQVLLVVSAAMTAVRLVGVLVLVIVLVLVLVAALAARLAGRRRIVAVHGVRDVERQAVGCCLGRCSQQRVGRDDERSAAPRRRRQRAGRAGRAVVLVQPLLQRSTHGHERGFRMPTGPGLQPARAIEQTQ